MICRFFSLYFFLIFCFALRAQHPALVAQVLSDADIPLPGTRIYRMEHKLITISDKDGFFSIPLLPLQKNTIRIVNDQYPVYTLVLENVHPTDTIRKIIRLSANHYTVKDVKIFVRKDETKNYVSTFKIDPKIVKYNPSPFGDFNKILPTIGLGVSSNNELSSQYTVRGGNFDENLIYVNDMEVYRPFLIRSGQQEGLSFINPDLVSDIRFSAGAWEAKYGDKLSSVLAVKYKVPQKFKASATASLLSNAAHIENISHNKKISYIIGIRQKSAQYLFNSLPVKGQYKPRFWDAQSLIHVDLTPAKDSANIYKKTYLEFLTSYALNKYLVQPEKSQTTFGTLAQAIRLDVDFEGQELLEYNTAQSSVKFSERTGKKFKTDIMLSAIHAVEREQYDVESIYRLSDVDTDPNSSTFNKPIFVRGTGNNYAHARNQLKASLLTLSQRLYHYIDSVHTIEWGYSAGYERIKDYISEYNFSDSAQYVEITHLLNSNAHLKSRRVQAYTQHTISKKEHNITYGLRLNYWTLNQQLLVSPRIQYAYKPGAHPKTIYKLAAGVYSQPPFYREMRNFDGVINTRLKAQQSYHFIAGIDYLYDIQNRKFKFSSELYCKYLTNVVPYDIDNVRIRYYAQNSAVAYVTGADFRVSGEFLRGEESWFSLGIMSTKEDVQGDSVGYIRRPTDQRITSGIFFQDHLPGNPSIKMFLNFTFGSGLPFGVPNNPKYRSVFTMPPYRRVDIGFSKLLSFQDKETLRKKVFESIWISAEVLNLLGVNNTISYLWVNDYQNNRYAVPNTLSQRFLNFRIIARF